MGSACVMTSMHPRAPPPLDAALCEVSSPSLPRVEGLRSLHPQILTQGVAHQAFPGLGPAAEAPEYIWVVF